ncbi:MAG: Hsp33 family molecular chaperone HslO [Clostridia bacterium]|nr:Hsp33 family molecular chaperone HslO [Clostridia bacterium]
MQNDMLYPDRLMRLSLMGGEARAFLIESTHLTERARSLHSTSKTATAALGRTLTLTSILGAMLKGEDESVTVRLDGDGPAGVILCVGKPDGSVKGFVSHPGAEVARRGEKLDVGALVGHNGTLTVIKDLRLKEPYIGQVPLVSGEIGEDFAMYFTSSEQTPSLVSVGVLVADRVVSSGALVIQLMPGASEAAIQSIENSAGMFMDISKTLLEYHLEGTCEQLLTHLEPEILDTVPVAYRCGCTRQKVETMLMSLGENELNDMIKTQNGAEVDCHFCNTRQRFTAEELKNLIARIKEKQNTISDAK